uniref:Dolichyl-diphosphooligosaccharide--protein glycosyltransferase 48 kDa subunit n=1 Tax=Tetradesmus obliquus TaxID=3088 RepID=A0A383W075_TETOB|eukprot:jgi/Sobl393_1/941/SZX70590.1
MQACSKLPLLLVLLAAALLCSNVANAAENKRVLALIGTSSIKDSHSQFFSSLKEAGFSVDIKSAKDKDLKLKDFDTFLYDSLIVFAPKAAKFGGDISSAAILDFVDSGKNLLLAASSDASDAVRSLALECGVELDDKATTVYDHFSHQAANGATDPTLIATAAVVDSKAIFGSSPPKAPILFKGVAATVPASAELVTVALSGEASSYSHDPKKAMPEPPSLPVGGTAALVSLVQARNNARVMVAGSLDMFSNELFDASVKVAASGAKFAKSGNKDFATAVALWTLGDRGVLKVGALSHHLVSDPAVEPSLYRVNDEVEVALDVHLVEGGKITPYQADDLQVSFVMLDPYVRQPMTNDGAGRFSLRFTVPDVYGVFKYVIDYKHAGYSYINLQRVVPVRPFKHDEYERFLAAAWPYYASVASTMAAFFMLGWVYLYSK